MQEEGPNSLREGTAQEKVLHRFRILKTEKASVSSIRVATFPGEIIKSVNFVLPNKPTEYGNFAWRFCLPEFVVQKTTSTTINKEI
ncbi:hypothetical protein, partial [Bartonella sp. AP72JLCBS]|uniref:hypothetical protein n=1 Tax=Bartonella sp. AP72JLCBS TaxID=3243502 RepID=UPI0035CEBCB0